MSEKVKIPVWFWLLAIIFLLWNLMGVIAFAGDLNATKESLEAMGSYTETEIDLMMSLPSWTKIFYGLATISGLLGAISLVMRKRFAVPLFIISLITAAFHHIYIYTTTDAMSILGSLSKVMSGVVFVICFIQIWISRMANSRGWIN